LRIALITHGMKMPAWLADVISSMQPTRNIAIARIISLPQEAAETRRQGIETRYFRFQEALEAFRHRNDAGGNGLSIDARSRYPDAIANEAAETQALEGVDLIINCGVDELRFRGLCGAIGGLSYSFSGTQGDLGLFRAMIHDGTDFSIAVNFFEGQKETRLEHARPALPERPGLRDLQRAVHDRAAVVVTKALRTLTNKQGISPAETGPPLPAMRAVDTASMLRFFFRRGVESLKGRLIRLRPERYWVGDDFNWFLAYRTNPADFVCNTNRFCADGFELFLPPLDKFYADPFVIQHKGVDHVFFEAWEYKTDKGVICWMQMGPDGRFSDPETVLAEAHHLSYPFVFEDDGHLYMIPESAAARSVNLYKAVEFPRRWEKVATLLDNVSAADATLIRHEGRWWMFATVGENGSSKNDQLHLYFTDQLFGPWHAHQENPVKIDVATARPAGRLYLRNGKLIRPSQDCSATYGGALTLSEVTHLSPERFVEVEVDKLSPDWLPFNVAFHTLSSSEALEVIDGRMMARGNRRFPTLLPKTSPVAVLKRSGSQLDYIAN
jgi:hypothetical protein